MSDVALHTREIPRRMAKGRLIAEMPSVLDCINFRGTLNTIGAFSYGNVNATVCATDIGRYCSLAHDVMIGPGEHPVDWMSSHGFAFNDRGTFGHSPDFMEIVSPNGYDFNSSRVKIGNDVWIGARAFVRKGVTIGNGAIVAANAAVASDVEPYAIVGGTPAKVIRRRFSDALIERLEALQWWNYRLHRGGLGEMNYSDVEGSISRIEDAVGKGLPLLVPRVVTFEDGQPVEG